jgi:hypothetical protein
MANVSDNYVRLLYKRYELFAAWLPNTKVQLGDVGVIEGKYFRRVTTLGSLGVGFKVRVGSMPLAFNDNLTAGLQVHVNAEGGVAAGAAPPLAEGCVSIQFAGEGAFLFHAFNCYTDEVEDKVAVGNALVALGERWDADWALVDTLVRAGSATILLSNSRAARLDLRAKAAADLSNLANPELGLGVASQSGDVTQFLAEKGLTPLFRLSKLGRSWIDWLRGKSKTIYFGGPSSAKPAPPEEEILEHAAPDLS